MQMSWGHMDSISEDQNEADEVRKSAVRKRKESEKQSATSVLFEGSLHTSSSEQETSIDSYIEVVPEQNEKKILYAQGLYDPGSGELCTKYVPATVKKSKAELHPYLAYPAVQDPGIVEAFRRTRPDKIYADDGQELYLDLCAEMDLAPVRMFYNGLLNKVIDLRYYHVNPKQIRVMCLALWYNKTVQRFDLTGNFLNYDNNDPSYHLGELLAKRSALQDLVLAGCRLGPKGIKKLVVPLAVRKMNLLDLSGNNLGDEGLQYINEKLYCGGIIKQLNLGNNNLTSDSAKLLAGTLTFSNTITHLDLSKNVFAMPKGISTLIRVLSDSIFLEHLNLAWTHLSISKDLAPLFHIDTLKVLNLSNNKLTTKAATAIAEELPFSVNLKTLDLSGNPFKPDDALQILLQMKLETVPLQELYMNYIVVDQIFTDTIEEIMANPDKRVVVVTHGEVNPNYALLPVVPIEVLALKRIAVVYETEYSVDIAAYLLKLSQKHKILSEDDLIQDMLKRGFTVDMESVQSLVNNFPGRTKKAINFTSVGKFIHEIWPDKHPGYHVKIKPRKSVV